MERDYQKILPLDGEEFVTTQGVWRATVSEYPAAIPADADLLHLKINFQLQLGGIQVRSLDLWIQNAPDVTLVAEYIGLLAAINRWLEDFEGDEKLLYDSGLRQLVPHHRDHHGRCRILSQTN
jgi:hypothetical protein